MGQRFPLNISCLALWVVVVMNLHLSGSLFLRLGLSPFHCFQLPVLTAPESAEVWGAHLTRTLQKHMSPLGHMLGRVDGRMRKSWAAQCCRLVEQAGPVDFQCSLRFQTFQFPL